MIESKKPSAPNTNTVVPLVILRFAGMPPIKKQEVYAVFGTEIYNVSHIRFLFIHFAHIIYSIIFMCTVLDNAPVSKTYPQTAFPGMNPHIMMVTLSSWWGGKPAGTQVIKYGKVISLHISSLIIKYYKAIFFKSVSHNITLTQTGQQNDQKLRLTRASPGSPRRRRPTTAARLCGCRHGSLAIPWPQGLAQCWGPTPQEIGQKLGWNIGIPWYTYEKWK